MNKGTETMVRRRREASHSASALQLEQNSVSNQEKATRGKKEVRTAGSRQLKDSQQNKEKEQPIMKNNCVSSRTRAKTQQRGFTEQGVLRSGRKRVQNKNEVAEDKSKAASYNPHPTPSSSIEATPQTRSSAGRRHNPSTDSCQNTSTQNPSTSTHRHKNSGKKHSKTGRVNRNSNSDSDSFISIEEEESDGTEDDDARANVGDSAEVESIQEVDCEGVDRESGKGSEDGGRSQQERRSSCSSSWMCRHQRATQALEHGSSAHHQKAPFKRRWPGDDEDDSSAKKHPAASKRKQVASPTSESSHGNATVQDQQEQLQNVSQVHSRPEVRCWLDTFKLWGNAERMMALDDLIQQCEVPQVRHMMHILQPHFQRDFISLLPKEVALHVLTYLKPRDLMKAAQTCRYWRMLCEDNLLWREKCEEEGIGNTLFSSTRAKDQSTVGCYKALFLQQSEIEDNWRKSPLRPPMLLRSHDDHVITCLEFCGQRIVSGSDDYTLKVWSAVTGKCLKTLVGHTGGVWSSQMSGNIVISGSTDRSLRVWNADTGECKHVLYGHTSTVRCMSLYGKKVVSGSRDATMRMWDIETGECLHVLSGHVAAVRCVLYDGKHVVSGAYDYTVRIWKPETETCLHVLRGHTNRVYSLQFDGVHIVSGSLDTSIRVWNVNTGICLHTLVGHQSLTSGLELKDNILVSGNADSTVKVWDITTGHCLQTLQGPNKHQSAVTCLQFNKKFVVTSSDDGTVKIWDLHTGEFLRDLLALSSGGSGGVVWRLRCSNTQMVCAVGSRNGTEDTKLMVLDFDVHEKKES